MEISPFFIAHRLSGPPNYLSACHCTRNGGGGVLERVSRRKGAQTGWKKIEQPRRIKEDLKEVASYRFILFVCKNLC